MRQSTIERFDRWAATYDQSILRRWYFSPVHSRMLDLLEPEEPPRTILDVGCGTGRLLKAASMRWPQAHMSGVDPAEQMISHARGLNATATFMVAPAESLPFPDRIFDLVFSSLSFHHWADQSRGLQEIARVLREGGQFCLADHDFMPSNLFHEKARGRSQTRKLLHDAGLGVILQRRMWLRFVLITLSRK